MDSLDKKAFEVFSGRVVPKGATKKIKDSANMPTYVLEYLLGTYCTSDDEQEIEAGIEQVKRIWQITMFDRMRRRRSRLRSRKMARIPSLISCRSN